MEKLEGLKRQTGVYDKLQVDGWSLCVGAFFGTVAQVCAGSVGTKAFAATGRDGAGGGGLPIQRGITVSLTYAF